jgi:hypothetical protein
LKLNTQKSSQKAPLTRPPWELESVSDPLLDTSLGRAVLQDLDDSWKELQSDRARNASISNCSLSPSASNRLQQLIEGAEFASIEYLKLLGDRLSVTTQSDPLQGCATASQALESHSISWYLRSFLVEIALEPRERHLVAAFAACVTYMRKAARCLALLRQHKQATLTPQLLSELRMGRSPLWSPSEFPSWLVFEVEQGIVIRNIQVQVAKEMLRNPKLIESSLENRCLQLQMGEGKTSVILPILCLALGNRTVFPDAVARVTVLPSLFPTVVQDLQMRIGGLLRRRIFVFPFQRVAQMSENTLPAMLKQCQQCLEDAGVIVTVPEHRLSFLLKWKLSSADEEQQGIVNGMDKILRWMDEHCIDLLDESDELLRHRFQLLYPFGARETLDGGEERWRTAQQILHVIWKKGEHIEKIVNGLGEHKIRRDPSKSKSGWSTFRVLDVKSAHMQLVEKIYDELCSSGYADFNLQTRR